MSVTIGVSVKIGEHWSEPVDSEFDLNADGELEASGSARITAHDRGHAEAWRAVSRTGRVLGQGGILGREKVAKSDTVVVDGAKIRIERGA